MAKRLHYKKKKTDMGCLSSGKMGDCCGFYFILSTNQLFYFSEATVIRESFVYSFRIAMYSCKKKKKKVIELYTIFHERSFVSKIS